MLKKSRWMVQCCNKAWDSELARSGKSRALKVLDPEKSESVLFRLPGGTVTSKTSEIILGLWFVCGLCHTCEELQETITLCLHVFTLGDFDKHSLSEDIEFALLSCHGTADCDMNYLNWTNWLLHSSSRSLCGHSLDVHCRLERINRKT